MNPIPALQNAEAQLKLLRARSQMYFRAKVLLILQLLLTLVVPLVGALVSAHWSALRVYFATAALIITVLDILILDRRQKLLVKQAAKIAEQFDCAALTLDWDQFSVGDKLEPEDVASAARAYKRGDGELRNWYPEAVGTAPLHLARIICQRCNLRYDSRLRRLYSSLIVATAFLLIVAVFMCGLVQHLSMAEWVLAMAPATPILAWAGREFYRQSDTAEFAENVMKEARTVWRNALTGKCNAADCRTKSRELQSALYRHRANGPLILPILYYLKRPKLEAEIRMEQMSFCRNMRGHKPVSHPEVAGRAELKAPTVQHAVHQRRRDCGRYACSMTARPDYSRINRHVICLRSAHLREHQKRVPC